MPLASLRSVVASVGVSFASARAPVDSRLTFDVTPVDEAPVFKAPSFAASVAPGMPAGTVLVGELGLGGQLRQVSQLELRLQEAARLGFVRAVVPRGSGLGAQAAFGLQLLEAGSVAEALVAALGVDPAAE